MSARDNTHPPGRLALARMALVRRALPSISPAPRRLAAALRGAVLNLAVVGVTVYYLPGVTVSDTAALIRLVVLISLLAALLRPLLFALGVAVGGTVVIILGLVAQAGVMYAALTLDPGVHVDGFPSAFAAAWITAGVSAGFGWLTDAGSEAAFFAQILRQVVRHSPRHATYDSPGMIVVQLDGLSAPLLRWSLLAGTLPTISRWVRLGTHHLSDWNTGLPSTTPGSQAGILHGAGARVPAFRWFEKDTGRLMVANRPRDAADVEARLSDGNGLLAGGGISISNVFSGDAELSLLTFSRAFLPSGGARGYATFLSSPQGFSRAFVLTIGAMITSLLQVRRQSRLNIVPRVPATRSSIALRGLSTVLLRDLDVTLLAEGMARGAPVIYLNLVDYDEVAHHAGPTRSESQRTLQQLDGVLRTVERLGSAVKRPYEIVVLSDHGQSQGATFKQRYTETLDEFVASLVTDGQVVLTKGRSEAAGPLNALLTELAHRPGKRRRARRRAPVRHQDNPVLLSDRVTADVAPTTVVAASGNLALIYLPEIPGRATLEEVDRRYPSLVAGLRGHPGIGIVVVRSEVDGAIALGPAGSHRLADGVVTGLDPLLGYGDCAAADLLQHQNHDHVGDLVVVSRIDAGTDEVAAFEELVGSHGGLGGDQTQAFLLYPAAWPAPATPPQGPDDLFWLLKGWRVTLQAAEVGSTRLG